MLATFSVCCGSKPRNCFFCPCALKPQNALRTVEEKVVWFQAAELLLAGVFFLSPLFSIT